MDVTEQPPPGPTEALAWLVKADGFARFLSGPPRLVRIVVRDPLDADQQVDVLRVVVDDITAEAAFLDAVRQAQAEVAAAQAEGHFAFLAPEARGWRPDEQRGW